MSATIPLPLALGRFKQLPLRSTEVWQGGLVKLPAWIDNPAEPDAPPYRPTGAFWASLRTGLIHLDLPAEGKVATPELALSALLDFGLKYAKQLDGRPARIEVMDSDLRDTLAPSLAGLGMQVEVVQDLPYMREALRGFEESAQGGVRLTGLLEVENVTPERIRAFADAAARFYTARPWQHLANEDLIVVEAPQSGPDPTHLCVLGQAGEQFGLSFFESRRDFERVLEAGGDPRRGPTHANGVTFGPIDDLPFGDVDAWEQYQFPVAANDAYPFVGDLHVDGTFIRPDAAALTPMEAVLRAIADTTEDDLDSGRWHRHVETFDGPVTVTLSLPFLLEAEAGHRSTVPPPAAMVRLAERGSVQIARLLDSNPSMSLDDVNAALERAHGELVDGSRDGLTDRPLTPLEQAQDVCYEAIEATGRLQVKLARKALALSPDCADAWVILGDAAASPEAALDCYQRGVEAGARAIGANAFTDLAGEFWERLETRPYMRARLAAAQQLLTLGREAEALDRFRELLRLNPNDNQGVRHILLPTLLETGADEEAGELLTRYPEDIGAMWPYARTLWLLRTSDRARAQEALREAILVNPHVARYLTNPQSLPAEQPPYYTLGSKEEAASVADWLLDAFETTAGAIQWLRTHASRAQREQRAHGGRASKRTRRR